MVIQVCLAVRVRSTMYSAVHIIFVATLQDPHFIMNCVPYLAVHVSRTMSPNGVQVSPESQLRSARYPLVFREVIESFLSKLPTSMPFQMLRHSTMKDIDSVQDDDVGVFLRITNKVLDIDLLYRHPSSSTRPPAQTTTTRSVPQPPHAHPSVTHILTTPTTSSGSHSLSLICSNCHARGHTGATCFKPGGGLEG